VLGNAGLPAALVSAGGPHLAFAPIEGSTQLTPDFFVQPDRFQGTVPSPHAHGVSLSCTPDHEHVGRDWVLDWCETEGAEQQHPAAWADGVTNTALPKAPSTVS